MSTSSSNLVLYIYCQYSMDLPEKILILISSNSTWFVWHETERSWRRTGEVENFPFLFKWGSKGMVFLYCPRFHWNMEWHEEDFPWKIFPNISSCQHKKRNMWDSTISWGDTLRVLGKIWATVHSMPSSSDTVAHSIFLWRTDAYWPQYHWCSKWRGIGR